MIILYRGYIGHEILMLTKKILLHQLFDLKKQNKGKIKISRDGLEFAETRQALALILQHLRI